MRRGIVLLVVALGACHVTPEVPMDLEDDAQAQLPPGVVDVRVTPSPPGPDDIDLVTPEAVIQPGEEKMLCIHMVNTHGDFWLDSVLGMQGSGGHHIALFTSDHPQPAGTLIDCTSPETNADMKWFAFNVNLPAGDAIEIPEGFPFVIQYHYINSSDQAILVRDVVRLHVAQPAAVVHPISTLVLLDQNLDIPPGTSHITWDCVFPAGADIIEQHGHMHDHGAAYSLDIGPSVDQLTRIDDIDPWQAIYRDAPIVTWYLDAPLHLAPGSVMRTTCAWNNPTGEPLTFPVEMCDTFGYFYSSQQYQCTPE